MIKNRSSMTVLRTCRVALSRLPESGVLSQTLPARAILSRAASSSASSVPTKTTPSIPPVPTSTVPHHKPVGSGLQQANNRAESWSPDQRPKEVAYRGPRFEQRDIDAQPNAGAAIDYVNELPPIAVQGRIATCDGGGGPLGHPKVFINLDRPGVIAKCKYCGTRFYMEPAH